jgi:hypothetical protein
MSIGTIEISLVLGCLRLVAPKVGIFFIGFKMNDYYEEKREYWGEGEWVYEPDLVEFEHAGLQCRIRRNAVLDGYKKDESLHIFGGHLCGYVRLPKEFPDHAEDDINVEIHGGITYDQLEEDGYTWIGFDCGHSGDLIPSMKILEDEHKIRECFPLPEEFKNFSIFNPTYRNIDYVTEETKSLAEQIKKLIEV